MKYLYPLSLLYSLALAISPQKPFITSAGANVTLVPVTLGIMSRCPDAAICESIFDDVLDRAGQKVQMHLSFIAKLNDSDPTYGVTCMHGPYECAGNVHELCVISRFPDQRTWWPFVNCLNYNGREQIGKEGTARKCAGVVGIDWEESGVGACVDGLEGSELLRDSVRNTTAIGIQKSCTIIINGFTRCIVDGGRWSQCDDGHTAKDFVSMIDKEYGKLNP